MADAATEEEVLRRRRESEAAATERFRFPAVGKRVDPAFQPGAISAATAGGQSLVTATRPGEGALDIVPHGTPLMSVRGVQDISTGQTQFVPLQQNRDTFNDLAGRAIEQRQAFINNRKQQILNQLPYVDKRQGSALTVELRSLERDEGFAQRDRHWAAMENAKNLEQQFKFDKERSTADQFSNIAKSFQEIADNDPDRETKIWQILADNPRGATTSGGRAIIGTMFGKQPPAVEQVEAAIEEFRNSGMALTGGTVSNKGRANLRFQPEERLAATTHAGAAKKLSGSTGLTPSQFAGVDITQAFATDAESTKDAKEVKYRNDDGKNVVFTDPDGETHIVPRQQFNAWKTAFKPSKAKVTQGTVKSLGVYNPETDDFDVEEEEEEE